MKRHQKILERWVAQRGQLETDGDICIMTMTSLNGISYNTYCDILYILLSKIEYSDTVKCSIYSKIVHVKHPSYYNKANDLPCIDKMTKLFGVELSEQYMLGSVFAHYYRAGKKAGETVQDDILNAIGCLAWLLVLRQDEENK